jgi:tRNA(His) guanylyltransferase
MIELNINSEEYMVKDCLGDRMKENYEDRARVLLPRRTYTILRLDGKAFHTFTKIFKRPFDEDLINMMDQTAIALCQELQGTKFAYVQSDEISILLTDFETLKTCAWFDGNLQKMVSVSASIATAAFNAEFINFIHKIDSVFSKINQKELARFDSRAFTIPDPAEVENYFIWRQQDCSRNSISMVAQSLYSHKQLQAIKQADLQEMIFQKGINWNDYPAHLKRGRVIMKETYEKTSAQRLRWVITAPPVFTQDREFLINLISEK